MQFSKTFVAFVTLALSAVALPAEKSSGTLRVPLTKRADLIDHDGIANADFLRNHANSAAAKFRRSFEFYERNTGSPHPSARSIGEGQDYLTEVNDGSLWQGEVHVGTPAVTFRVGYDTGISEFWIPRSDCGDVCSGHDQYDPVQSSSSTDLMTPFSLPYADGSTVSGGLYTDVVKFGGLLAMDQTFGAANNISAAYWLYNFETDGLLGLGFSETSALNASSVFDTLVSQGKIVDNVFSFRLRSAGAELMLGGVNTELYKEPFYYSPITNKGHWQVDMDSLAINGEQKLGKTSVIINTGITLLMGDTEAVKELYSTIEGAKDGSETIQPGFYSVPCDNIPTVSLTFAGKTFDIAPETFSRGRVDGSDTECIGGITGAPIGTDFWIVGDVFMQNVYTVFDVGQGRVGFAEYA